MKISLLVCSILIYTSGFCQGQINFAIDQNIYSNIENPQDFQECFLGDEVHYHPTRTYTCNLYTVNRSGYLTQVDNIIRMNRIPKNLYSYITLRRKTNHQTNQSRISINIDPWYLSRYNQNYWCSWSNIIRRKPTRNIDYSRAYNRAIEQARRARIRTQLRSFP